MRRAFRTIRWFVLIVAAAGALLAGAPPAGAASYTVNGAVVAPLSFDRGNARIDYQGVLVDGALGVVQFTLLGTTGPCCQSILLTSSDGSTLRLGGNSESEAPVIELPDLGPPLFSLDLVVARNAQFVVTQGTGRFAGASGTATLQAVRTLALPTVMGLGAPGSVMLGTLSASITTP